MKKFFAAAFAAAALAAVAVTAWRKFKNGAIDLSDAEVPPIGV